MLNYNLKTPLFILSLLLIGNIIRFITINRYNIWIKFEKFITNKRGKENEKEKYVFINWFVVCQFRFWWWNCT